MGPENKETIQEPVRALINRNTACLGALASQLQGLLQEYPVLFGEGARFARQSILEETMRRDIQKLPPLQPQSKIDIPIEVVLQIRNRQKQVTGSLSIRSRVLRGRKNGADVTLWQAVLSASLPSEKAFVEMAKVEVPVFNAQSIAGRLEAKARSKMDSHLLERQLQKHNEKQEASMDVVLSGAMKAVSIPSEEFYSDMFGAALKFRQGEILSDLCVLPADHLCPQTTGYAKSTASIDFFGLREGSFGKREWTGFITAEQEHRQGAEGPYYECTVSVSRIDRRGRKTVAEVQFGSPPRLDEVIQQLSRPIYKAVMRDHRRSLS